MPAIKSEKISISLPDELLTAVDEFVGAGSRSGYFQTIAEAHLRKEGKLQPDPIAVEMARVRELIETNGVAAVKSKLDELVMATVTAGGVP